MPHAPKRPLPLRSIAAAASLCLAACKAPERGADAVGAQLPSEAALVERIERERNHASRLYDVEKQRLEEASQRPRAFEYDGLGSIIVHRFELLGGPDQPYLRARFSYVNSSGRTLPLPTVSLVALSPAGRVVGRAERTLTRTIDDTMAPDTAHTTWLDLDIGDLYMVPGWDWTLELGFAD